MKQRSNQEEISKRCSVFTFAIKDISNKIQKECFDAAKVWWNVDIRSNEVFKIAF